MGNNSAAIVALAHALREKDKRKKAMRMMSHWWVWGARRKVEYGDKEKMREHSDGRSGRDTGIYRKGRQLTAQGLRDGGSG